MSYDGITGRDMRDVRIEALEGEVRDLVSRLAKDQLAAALKDKQWAEEQCLADDAARAALPPATPEPEAVKPDWLLQIERSVQHRPAERVEELPDTLEEGA